MRQADEPDIRDADLLEALVAATLDAIVVVDHDRRIVAFNTGAERLFACKSDDVIGKLIDTVLLGDIVDNQTTERITLSARLPAGDVVPVEGRITTVRLGRTARAMLILRDATPLRSIESRLRESEERFRLDITQLKEAERALLTHAAELERSNAELEHLAYVAAHELQGPLRVVASYVELLAERYKGQLDEGADRWIGYVSGGIERMKAMIDALLALARVTTDTQPFASAAFAPIINRTWQELLNGQARRDACLSCGPLPTLVVDSSQIGQLFQNLLGNAFKYSRSDVPLRAHISAERRISDSGAVWEFAVRDNGIGLDVAEAERIFQIFERLHRHAEIKGTGIGLAICRRIVERHGGRLWVESTPGEGATFRFTIRERAG